MQSIRIILILAATWLCVFALKPTYSWYFEFTPEQRALASTSKKAFRDLTQNIEKQAQILKNSLGSPDNYRIALSNKDRDQGKYAVNLSDDNPVYTLSLSYEQFRSVVETANSSYRNWNALKESYFALQRDIELLEEIQGYQKIKNRVIKLGLDIAGGVHFSLGIDEEKMLQLLNEEYAKLLDADTIKASLLSKDPKISQTDLDKQIKDKISTLRQEKEQKLSDQKKWGIDQALLKIRNRVDQFGVSEPVILRGPNDTIVVELAGEKDVESAKEIFTRVGVLSFQIVNEDFMKTIPLSNRSFEGYIVNPSHVSRVPSNTQFLPVQGVDRFGQSTEEGYLAIYKNVELDGSRLVSAQSETDNLGQRVISFRMDSAGAEIFGNVTRNNVGKRLAIVLDGVIQSAPNIREAIIGGAGNISGSFTMKEANLLATILRSGSLPVPLKIEEQKVIGPSLGLEEVQKGVHATFVALLLVIVFMFIYYGLWGGLSTNLAQVFNIVIILAIMAQMGATLTLPGLAAIVLTIAMSVDANIIIHERIKEDLRLNFDLSSALASGYHSAIRTILDSNITTFIPGFILASIGDGPIRGFGIVLMIGLIVNLFTAVFCTRTLYNILIHNIHIKNIFWSRFFYAR